MKIQDIVFAVIILVLLFMKKKQLILWVGIGCIVLSIPLFMKWIFFTAQRLVLYAFICFLLCSVFAIMHERRLSNR